MSTESNEHERNFCVVISHPTKVNEPWLERKAIELEEALIRECSGQVLGPSVTANFSENGFELDFTVVADSAAEAYEKFAKVMGLVERVAGLELASPTSEDRSDKVRTGWLADEPVEHELAVST